MPALTTCFGPRTELAGLNGSTWLTTSQSKSIRMAARCWLTVAGERLDVGRDQHRLELGEGEVPVRAPRSESAHGCMWAVKNSQKRRSGRFGRGEEHRR